MLRWCGGVKRAWSVAGAILLVGSSVAWIGRVTLACIGGQYDSIHFHSGQPDYGLPPRRAILTWRGEHDDRPQSDDDDGSSATGQELTDEKDELRRVEIDRKRKIMLRTVDADVETGRWRHAHQVLAQFCDRLGWRGGLRDRDQILQQLASQSDMPAQAMLVHLSKGQRCAPFVSGTALVRLYLKGLTAEESKDIKGAQTAFQRVSVDPHSGFLREHALYQLASLQADQNNQDHAIDLYWQLLRESPHTVKRQDALVMIARNALLRTEGAELRIADGRAALDRLRREFPHTRFHRDLIGLQGRLHFLAHEWNRAAECYFTDGDLASVELVIKAMPPEQSGPVRVRLLAAYVRALTSTMRFDKFELLTAAIDQTRHAMTSQQAAQFGQLLLNQPDTAASYIYYRLYHTGAEDTGTGDQNVINTVHTDGVDKHRHSLTVLADRLVARYPATRLSVPVQVRLAEVYYQGHHYNRALFWANRALRTGMSDRALYVRAATRQKLGRKVAALADFERLLHLFPGSPLRHGVLENLVQFYERQHRFGAALDLYFALDYKPDIAFLLDVRMTPAQIADYLRRHSRSPQRNLVAYSLGIRYLRAERWEEARRMLTSVPHATYLKFANPKDKDGDGLQTDPLRAVAKLEPLHHAVLAARTDRARASALYWYAHYYATHDELLLYNLALWNGEREINFQFYWNERFATDEDRAAVHAHMYAHETYARSRRICLDLVRRYPDTPTVPYALYRAAVDDLHLATFNSWWVEKQPIDFAKEMHRLKQRLVREYPHHSLAHKLLAHARLHPEQPAQLWRPQHNVVHTGTVEGVARED
jgi:TolA-binding protein